MEVNSKMVLDLGASVIILLAIIAPRFNSWTKTNEKIFSGTPHEYIDNFRYCFYWSVYLFTYIVLVAVLYNFPELMPVGKTNLESTTWYSSLSEIFGQHSIAISCLIITSVLNNSKANHYDEVWRDHLHKWARIPRAVEEIKIAIIQGDGFTPGSHYIDLAKTELRRESEASPRGEQLLSYWIELFDNWEVERQNRTINWSYIRCLCLMLIVRDICAKYGSMEMKRKDDRIQDIGKIIPFLSRNNQDAVDQQHELEELSQYFIECISKTLVKKYSAKQGQLKAFQNLGFDLKFHDAAEVHVGEAILYCVFGVIIISGLSTAMITTILGRERSFISWTMGGIIALNISIFVGLFIQQLNSRREAEARLPAYLLTLTIATIGSLGYMHFASGPSSSVGRIVLALSYSSLSVVVFRALEDIYFELRYVYLASLISAVSLGLVMGFLQMGISIAFMFDREAISLDTMYLGMIADNDWKLAKLGLVGVFKGFFLGGMVTYLILDMMRRKQLTALRRSPRVKFNKIIDIKNKQESFRVNSKDLSKSGMLIRSGNKLMEGETVNVETPLFGTVKGIVRWVRPSIFGRALAGIEFTNESDALNNYIRKKYGEFYA